ncbi:MAG: IS110 family transposase [Anaerolineales bacterium]|nr:IS110 family transposase [Anaerolineales bacterium]
MSGLLVRRRQLEEMIKAEKNRLRTIQPSLQASVERIIHCIQSEKKDVEDQIGVFIAGQEKSGRWDAGYWRAHRAWDRSPQLHPWRTLPELGKMDRKKIAALVGVAPMNHDSGRKRGYRKTKGGRADVRSVLYMATLVACRYNPTIKVQYENLLKRGKEKKVALTACMRKFLTILNAMMRDQVPFRQRVIV